MNRRARRRLVLHPPATGLAVVEHLVRAHGGTVGIVDGWTGTTIEVALPGTRSEHARIASGT